jgi:hypothetical protein
MTEAGKSRSRTERMRLEAGAGAEVWLRLLSGEGVLGMFLMGQWGVGLRLVEEEGGCM